MNLSPKTSGQAQLIKNTPTDSRRRTVGTFMTPWPGTRSKFGHQSKIKSQQEQKNNLSNFEKFQNVEMFMMPCRLSVEKCDKNGKYRARKSS